MVVVRRNGSILDFFSFLKGGKRGFMVMGSCCYDERVGGLDWRDGVGVGRSERDGMSVEGLGGGFFHFGDGDGVGG